MHFARLALALFLALFILPLGVHAAVHWGGGWDRNWRSADWSSTGLLPPAAETGEASVRIYAARAGRWRGIFAVHSWIVLKDENGTAYERYDKVGWGSPIRTNFREADGRWFGDMPVLVFAADGERAAEMIPRIRQAVADYPYREFGDYEAWPGPNSNTFVAWVMTQVPEIDTALPPVAVGKDFPFNGDWFGPTPSRTGWRISLGGYLGLAVGWVEGIEVNILGAVAGLDIRRPGIKLPGFGRIGV